MANPTTQTELFEAAAEALQQRDGASIERLQGVARGWLQDDGTAAAIQTALGAMAEAAYELAEYEAA